MVNFAIFAILPYEIFICSLLYALPILFQIILSRNERRQQIFFKDAVFIMLKHTDTPTVCSQCTQPNAIFISDKCTMSFHYSHGIHRIHRTWVFIMLTGYRLGSSISMNQFSCNSFTLWIYFPFIIRTLTKNLWVSTLFFTLVANWHTINTSLGETIMTFFAFLTKKVNTYFPSWGPISKITAKSL